MTAIRQNIGRVGLRLRGAWTDNPQEPYMKMDVTEKGGSSYMSLVDNNTTMPPSASWQLQSQRGAAGQGVPAGGTTGQVLKKKSNEDFDTEWSSDNASVTSVNNKTGNVTLNANDVGALPSDTPIPTVPTNVSEFNNDAGYITKTVNDLVNYYLKSDTYTKTEVQQLISAIQQFTYQVVSSLPTASADTMNIIYLVPSTDPQAQNVKDEYITIDNGTEAQTRYTWEQIGSTAIDLSGYVTTTALNTALADYTTTAALMLLLSGKQDVIDSSHKLSADLMDDTNTTNKFTNATEKQTWNGKQDALVFNTAYDASTNKAATMADVPVVTGKADKVNNATSGNFAALDSNGNLTDSGHKHSDYLTSHQDISGKEDVTTIVAPVNETDATLPVTSLTCEIGKYYRLDVPVETLAVTLPAMTDTPVGKAVVLFLTGGTAPAVTITSTAPSGGTAPAVHFADGFEIKAGETNEVNCYWNGLAWIVASVKIVISNS